MKTAICLLVLLGLAACTVPAPLSSPAPTAEPPSPEDAVHPAEGLPAEVALVLRRSGGIAGVSEQWTIYTDGSVEAGDGRRWQAAPEEVARLVAEIERLGFFELDSRYVPFDTCCDRFTYELAVRSGERSHAVTVLEATPDVPEALWEVLDAVQRFLAVVTG